MREKADKKVIMVASVFVILSKFKEWLNRTIQKFLEAAQTICKIFPQYQKINN